MFYNCGKSHIYQSYSVLSRKIDLDFGSETTYTDIALTISWRELLEKALALFSKEELAQIEALDFAELPGKELRVIVYHQLGVAEEGSL